ncbi:hypothetical protein AURDEDRAFT_166949 [Auricularia subglabra TFB-10046 SS5]|nr:hypothetical protein AURDEDRAFT_166949 [Auricularia subglabra TFB-10046 SS5]
MPPRNRILRSFSTPVDPHDQRVHRQLSEKVIPWSKSPFNNADSEEPKAKGEDEKIRGDEDKQVVQKADDDEAPDWLELFFDLAWTVSFAGLTEGTPINGSRAILSYAVFFVLAWWLWVAQVLYDTKYFTNDVFHRIMLIFQFIAFVALSSFTEGFDIFTGITHDQTSGGIDLQVEDQYISRAFRAIALVFGITRFLLAVQYIRVSFLVKHRVGGNIFAVIASLLVSAVLFFISFFILLAFPRGFSGGIANIVKFFLWMLAIWHWGRGEGLNGLINPLVSVAKSVGFGFSSAAQILSMALLVLVVFMLYYASFDWRGTVSEGHQKLIVLVHFPIHLLVVLLLEGMKSVMGFLNLTNSLTFFLNKTFFADKALSLDEFKTKFAAIGLDFEDVLTQIQTANTTVPRAGEDETVAETEQAFRLLVRAVQAILDQFGLLTDDLKQETDDYIFSRGNSSNFALEDAQLTSGTTHLDDILTQVEREQISPVSWIALVAAGYLFSLLLLIIFRGGKSNTYFAWSILTRVVVATGLSMLFLLDFHPQKLNNFIDQGGFIPTVLGFYTFQYLLDYAIHFLMARHVTARLRSIASVAE